MTHTGQAELATMQDRTFRELQAVRRQLQDAEAQLAASEAARLTAVSHKELLLAQLQAEKELVRQLEEMLHAEQSARLTAETRAQKVEQ